MQWPTWKTLSHKYIKDRDSFLMVWHLTTYLNPSLLSRESNPCSVFCIEWVIHFLPKGFYISPCTKYTLFSILLVNNYLLKDVFNELLQKPLKSPSHNVFIQHNCTFFFIAFTLQGHFFQFKVDSSRKSHYTTGNKHFVAVVNITIIKFDPTFASESTASQEKQPSWHAHVTQYATTVHSPPLVSCEA